MNEKEEVIRKLRTGVINCNEKGVTEAVHEVIKKGFDPSEAIERGISEGMRVMGNRFDKMEIFLPELMIAADIVEGGLDILLPEIQKEKRPMKGRVVIGTIKGDIHSIGKDIVAAMLRAYGFQVHDLGLDVPISKFYEEAMKSGADIIAISALMSSTIGGQKDAIDFLEAMGERERFTVMVGGGAASPEWAERIGADGYAKTAAEAAKHALELLEERRGG
ncbi:MAG: corrinoid protein [Candidatus Bathyarchaeota archaeon]|nr:MAG: corrinoid protein [Candidatus Bathyarchaeota archaeon]